MIMKNALVLQNNVIIYNGKHYNAQISELFPSAIGSLSYVSLIADSFEFGKKENKSTGALVSQNPILKGNKKEMFFKYSSFRLVLNKSHLTF